MELIPILSTIILVATISTFILSIGAYILYKLREKKTATSMKTPPSTVQAELVVPADVIPTRSSMHGSQSPQYKSPFTVQKPAYPEMTDRQPIAEQDHKKFTVEVPEKVPERRKSPLRKSGDTKFFKYTSEGYVPTEEDKAVGISKWR